METLTARLDNKNEESSIRISDIDLKINTKIITDIDELKKEIETIEEYDRELDKMIINSNAQSQIKLTEIRKDLGIFVTALEDKITQTKKDLVDDTHNVKEMLFHKNGTFKLVKGLELDERIKQTKEQLQNEIIKKPLQFPIKIAAFIADEVSSKKVVNVINIFNTNTVFKYKKFVVKDYFLIKVDNFIVFSDPELNIIYISYDSINLHLTEEDTKREELLLKYEYKTKNNISKELSLDLSNQPFKIMFDIITNDRLSFSILRPQMKGMWEIKGFVIDIYYVENLVPSN